MTKKQFFVELIIVVLGVTIAFGLNSLKESYSINHKKKIAIDNIISELKANNKSIEEITNSQDSMLLAYNDTSLIKRTTFAFNTLNIKRGVYRSIESSGLLGEIDTDDLIDIMEVYEAYNTLIDLEKYLFKEVINLRNSENIKDNLDDVYFWVEQLNNNEKVLLKGSTELIDKLNTK